MKRLKFRDKKIMTILKRLEMTLLEHLERIVKLSQGKGLSQKVLDKAKSHIKIASNILQITPIQTVLFAHFLNRSGEDDISLKDISNSINCNQIQLLQYMNDIDKLEEKKLIRRRQSHRSSMYYTVSMDAIKAIRNGTAFNPVRYKNISIEEFFDALSDIFQERKNGELSFDLFIRELKFLIDENNHLSIVKKLKWYHFDNKDLALLMCFFDLFLSDDDDGVGFHNIGEIFERYELHDIERQFKSGKHRFMKDYNLIENAGEYGLGDPEYFKLTDKAKLEFLEEINIKEKLGKRGKNFIMASSLPEKKLFYNEKQNIQIAKLSSLLQETNFKGVQDRLAAKNMRKGFACLFYGAPGTGKTETVYQIARQTNRDILMLDIAETQSKWVGENEKLIKQVFDRYRGVVKAGGLAPILLFNEADAIIAKRLNISDDSRSVDQMENRVQNIILQEIENLDGILIATTNLTGNMDRAFERRFLYKIEFAKPDISIRQAIWKSIIPELSDMETKTLASKYDFSGGQIENIARKRAVDDIISAESANIDNLLSFCQEEILERGAGKKIGFVMSR